MERLYSLLILCFILTNGIKATDYRFRQGKNEFIVLSDSYSSFSLRNSVASFQYYDISTKKGMFTELIIPGYVGSGEYGYPKLPDLSKIIEIPLNAELEVSILNYKVEEYTLDQLGIKYRIMPRQPSVSKSANSKDIQFIFTESAYNNNAYNNTPLVSSKVLGIMRGVRMARIEICPVQYNPVSKTIRIYSEIEAEIHFRGGDMNKTIALKEKYYTPHFNSVYQCMANHKETQQRDTLSKYPIRYVIIADRMFESTLQPFIQWKSRKGFYIIEAYTDVIGTSTSAIQGYLKSLYTSGTPQNPAPTYVLLVGDVEQIPAFSGTSGSHPTDLYYFTYDGTGDIYADIYYGRFSATTTGELQAQIDKTLEYEQYLMPDPSFLNETLMIAGVDDTYAPVHGNGQINYGNTYYFNTTNGITSHNYLYPESGSSEPQIIADVNKGVAFANYTAHGSPGGWSDPTFGNNDVAGLTNEHKYALLIGNCCLTNKFDESSCFGETLLRSSGKGAIGYIGASNSSYWDEDFYFGVGATANITVNPVYAETGLGAYDCLFHQYGENKSKWYVTNGQINHRGKMAVTEGKGEEIYYWEIYHLMGDPSLTIYMTVPDALTISYNPSIPIGNTQLTINTEEDAYVAISQNNVLLDAKLADASGIVTLTFPSFSSPGKADIVATKQNRKPYVGTIDIITINEPWIVFKNFIIHDPAGNNNNLADYNESATLDVTLENTGLQDGNNLVATLSATDAYITITDSVENYNTIVSNNTKTQINAFAISVANNVPDQHKVPFTLSVTDGTKTWTGQFNMTCQAPLLSVSDSNIKGGIYLDNEIYTLVIKALNKGHSTSPVSSCQLSSVSSDIIINESIYSTGILNAGSSETAMFCITTKQGLAPGAIIPCTFTLTAGAYSSQKTINLSIFSETDKFESGDFSIVQWELSGTNTSPSGYWTITDVNPYSGTYCAKSGNIGSSGGNSASTFQRSILGISVNVLEDNKTVSFYKKVSSEKGEGTPYDWYDFLSFTIDDSIHGQWDGESDWSLENYPVSKGIHTLKWIYEKDGYVDDLSDCAWIDEVTLPVSPIDSPGCYTTNHNNVDAFNSIYLNAFPNPAGNKTFITYTIKKSSLIELTVHNFIGEKMDVPIAEKFVYPGKYDIELNTSKWSNGIYFCRLLADNEIRTIKIVVAH